ncbi:HAMP domain-containing histidine kinase [Sphingomonas ginsenosidivorax]|uniref:histidine kinase n=1 Tax=Sphingomonas ginsenosidivorax TaxID=862135 RepID=A0A5C6UIN9_9SPHN|nr:HAMP domain-containing sensor histidine kinase [Sphingomonas ginsenosidivorax]TXC71838.1 HAMP domain-containing histidine kinase [Sphingomonas ginsenosidivorax]
MRLMPRSLFGRLLAVATLATLAALLLASVAIGHVLERFVMRGFDDRLDAQTMVLARAVDARGRFDTTRAIDLPGFDEAGSGWIWQVRSADGQVWRNGAEALPVPASRADAPPPPPPGMASERARDRDRSHPGEGRDRTGQRQHFRTLTLMRVGGPVAITASGPRRVVEAPLREAMLPLLGSLALLGIGLAAATLVQLRIGLRPLRTLQAALGNVIAGRQHHVPTDLPVELAPLAHELNTLIDQNAEGLAHARRHVANLAHGLKTPLAGLGLELADRDPDGRLAAMLADIDRRVSHHLRRARAAMPGAPGRGAIPLAPAIGDLVDVLRRVHADRPIAVDVAVDGVTVGVDAQDLDEMLGNLLDNAWRYAATAIGIAAVVDAGKAVITIDDDGPGLDANQRAEALVPGRRLDEAGPGHGFGLPITQELAELNGGGLVLGSSPTLGGLRATLTLPL